MQCTWLVMASSQNTPIKGSRELTSLSQTSMSPCGRVAKGIYPPTNHRRRHNLRHNWSGNSTLCCSFISMSPFRKVTMEIHQLANHNRRYNLRHNWLGISALCCSFTSMSPFRKVAMGIRQVANHWWRNYLRHKWLGITPFVAPLPVGHLLGRWRWEYTN